ncbi:MAG: low molecular weight phosphotyrosine protein phosphatase [Verrucomicrobia bacterium]|nr:low molecular weight phosphotyrosine protein phosphatase [Verrucomicrobiota bacterium]MCH8526249.1 low molecular weight phosphotyrosine protein phosphatase [Kiritimatiellia bacterium]
MKKLLFVCLGNICRSPSAEAVFRAKVEDAGLGDAFEIDSAGTLAYHQGKPADARMLDHAAKRGYMLTSIARKVLLRDFDEFDLLIAMDDDNYRELRALAEDDASRAKVKRMMDYAPETGVTEVPDPYYGGAQGFERVLDLLETACDRLLADLR